MAPQTKDNFDTAIESLINQQSGNNKSDSAVFTCKINHLLTQKVVEALRKIEIAINDIGAGQKR
ncbi:MAG: hypothetical protein ACYDBV_10805 [Nitrospiria bacterium]